MKLKINKLPILIHHAIFKMDLPIKSSFALARIFKALDAEFILLESERVKLCQKHGKLDDASKNYIFETKEDELVFSKEFEALLGSEIELPFEKIPVDFLGDIKIKALDLALLEDILSFD